MHVLKVSAFHSHLYKLCTPAMAQISKSETVTSKVSAASGSKRATSGSPPPAKKAKPTSSNEAGHLDYTHLSPDWLTTSATPDGKKPSVQLTYRTGDMFADVPSGTVLVHACNTQGHWGAGIAKAFKQQYPNAYADHNKFCAKHHTKSSPVLTGTAQLLAPRDGDGQHWIGCLFTSAKYGKGKDKPVQIVMNTAQSMPMLLELIGLADTEITAIRMCKINSGKFSVPWEKTEEVLKNMELKPHWRTKIEIWEPEDG